MSESNQFDRVNFYYKQGMHNIGTACYETLE